jgi:hypothetical protein
MVRVRQIQKKSTMYVRSMVKSRRNLQDLATSACRQTSTRKQNDTSKITKIRFEEIWSTMDIHKECLQDKKDLNKGDQELLPFVPLH